LPGWGFPQEGWGLQSLVGIRFLMGEGTQDVFADVFPRAGHNWGDRGRTAKELPDKREVNQKKNVGAEDGGG